jgi:hypothetical protein
VPRVEHIGSGRDLGAIFEHIDGHRVEHIDGRRVAAR